MKKFLRKFETAMAAVAFAEAGEHETAREIMKEYQLIAGKVRTLKYEVEATVDNLTAMAIAFAEAGEHEAALEILKDAENKLKKVRSELRHEAAEYSINSA
jgi:hypothetical protein